MLTSELLMEGWNKTVAIAHGYGIKIKSHTITETGADAMIRSYFSGPMFHDNHNDFIPHSHYAANAAVAVAAGKLRSISAAPASHKRATKVSPAISVSALADENLRLKMELKKMQEACERLIIIAEERGQIIQNFKPWR